MESLRDARRAWIVAVTLFALSGCASSASPASDASKPADAATQDSGAKDGDIRATIDTFLGDPANGDPGKIVRFVKDSPDVLVVYRQSILQAEEASDDLRPLMLAAFAAGNVRAQLMAGKKEDMPVAGVRGMVAVYKKLQALKPDLRVSLYETYAAKEADGTLEAFVAERAKKD